MERANGLADRMTTLAGDRAAALVRWRAENDATGLDEPSLVQAATLATIETRDGAPALGDGFREFAQFIADMPF